MKKILCSLLTVVLTISLSFSVSAAQPETSGLASGEIPYNSYTYWTDYNTDEKTPVYSKPAYEVKCVIKGYEIGGDENSKFADVATDALGNSYVLDSGNSAVYIIGKDYSLVKKISGLSFEGKELNFKEAKGIFVDKENRIYIADTENARVIVLNSDGVVSRLLLLPDSELIPTGFEYKPVKIAVDSRNYIYIACDGSYYGAILYSPELEFLGFYGANTVKASVTDVVKKLWKRLTSNDAKRAAGKVSLPYTITDIVVGTGDFVYTATGRSGEEDETVSHGQICMLNPGGKDVLDASDKNFADYSVGALKRVKQVQDLAGITVDGNGYFYTYDTTYGRIFWYDSDCNLISSFGGSFGNGNQDGTFYMPSGIDINGTDIILSDSQKNTVTVFGITEYGALVRKAQESALTDNNEETISLWQNVISQDTNSQLAYRGLAKAYLDLGDNSNAMKYAKTGVDRDTYSEAFAAERTKVLEKSFVWIFALLVVIIAAAITLNIYLKKHSVSLKVNQRLKVALTSVLHPAESFRLVKEKQEGSVPISAVIVALFYVITVLNDTKAGFAFTVFDTSSYNAVYVFLSTVGAVLIWTLANWLVCTLAGGIGKIKEIFIVTAYSLIPIIFGRLCNLILTHILTPDEGAFLSIFLVVCTLYAAFMLIIGIMRIHDYEFGKFVATTLATVIGMVIIVFLLFLIFLIAQQAFGWVKTIYVELKYR